MFKKWNLLKFRCFKKPKRIKKCNKNFTLNIGSFGLIGCEFGIIFVCQLEAVNLFLKKNIKKFPGGFFYFNLLPNFSLSKKPLESRMGKGKGGFLENAIYVSPGRILVEIKGISKKKSFFLLQQIAKKFSLKVKIISLFL